MRALLDPNILISALLSPAGAPARVLRAWLDGAFELLVSQLLLAELERALGYPRLRRRIDPEEAAFVLEWLRRTATLVSDPDWPPARRSEDAGDDYLIVLAETENAALVSGDAHVLALEGDLPVFSAARFLALLDQTSG